MAEHSIPAQALLVVAGFSRHQDALDWARAQLEVSFGPLSILGPRFSFHHTKYYESPMGAGLMKQLLAFEQLIDQDQLPEIKLRTNQLEKEILDTGRFPDQRPLNLDPGLLTLGKFLLATTKDQAHRIYLRNGIYAEVTLRFQDGQFEPWPWTYADYREPEVRETLRQFRGYYRSRLQVSER